MKAIRGYFYILLVIHQVLLQSYAMFAVATHPTLETDDLKIDELFPGLTPQKAAWESPVKKSTTVFHTLDDPYHSPRNTQIEVKRSMKSPLNELSTDEKRSLLKQRLLAISLDNDDNDGKVKRSLADKIGNMEEENYDSNSDLNGMDLWNQAILGKKADEGTILKNLMRQDTTPVFGSPQEAKDEQNTISEIESLSRQSSKMPKDLHLPYMNGDMGLDFSKMDISVGKYKTDFNNDGENSESSFLKKNLIPVRGHSWETRNRDQIPKHQIFRKTEMGRNNEDILGYTFFPKQSRYPSFASPEKILPSQLESLEQLNAIPPIAPAMLSREYSSPAEPLPMREPTAEDEPAPVSEFIQTKEPASIPELPSLREIPPISEPREQAPEDLNPKDTFGS